MIKITLKIANIVKRIVVSISSNTNGQMMLELRLFELNWIYMYSRIRKRNSDTNENLVKELKDELVEKRQEISRLDKLSRG